MLAARSRKFSPLFCLYIQTNLNLSLRAAKYMCLRKEGEGFPFLFVSVVSALNGLRPK